MASPTRITITAGPTQEPIDDVRYLGNRSSGRMGVAIADAAAVRGWHVTLMLGPNAARPSDPRVQVEQFRTTADLEALLADLDGSADALVMAAAVSDFRPRTAVQGKIKRGGPMSLELEATPDLLAAVCLRARRPRLAVAFALEPAEGLAAAARAKLARKGADLIVANPLQTMDSDSIDATIISAAGVELFATESALAKAAFAERLLDVIASQLRLADAVPADASPSKPN